MNENEKAYRKVDNFYADNNKQKGAFGKTVFIPFLSGILGSVLVVGTCFGVPSIKSSLFKETTTASSSATGVNSNTGSVNTNYVSLSEYSDTSVGVAQKILPSIVGIEIESNVTSLFGDSGTSQASGSGIIISSDGYILTNNHVVSNSSSSSSFYQISEATQINVYLYNDETAYPAKIVGQDELTDIAVIKIDKTDLTAAEIGNSDTLQVGEFAMAVGNPLGMQSSITCGNISATNRKFTDSDGRTRNLIQTDAAINSGNSGGALVNSKGEVIGINTLKLAATGVEGMGFAIPINSVTDVYNQLIQYNKVKRPYIGISGVSVDEKTSKQYNLPVGVYVKSISNFSPAEKAGLAIGDVITKVNGQSVSSVEDINNIKNSLKIGDSISLTITRNGQESTVNLTLEEQP